jgi:VWFA-related protein
MGLSRGRAVGASCLGLAVLLVGGVLAQSATPQRPTFRGGTELVAVDFLAIDAEGRPIADLKPDELKLTVDGKPRTIESLQYLELASLEPRTKGALPPAKAVPLPFGSNVQRDAGRTIILLFHHTSIEPGDERPAREAIASFLDTLTPRDRVGLITFPQGAVLADLTTNHDRVRASLQTVIGHGPPVDQSARYVLRDLAAIVNGFKAIDGPKTVVLVSQSMPALAVYGRNSTVDDYVDLQKAASRTSAHFYIIQPHAFGAMGVTNRFAVDPFGSGTAGAASRAGTGIEDVAGALGGELFSLSAGADAIVERIARESSVYYLLGFTPTASEQNGKTHKIALSTVRPGVTIRARPAFLISKPDAPSKDPLPVSILKDAASHADLPLHAVAYAFRAPSPAKNLLKVLVVLGSPAPETKITEAAFALIDPKSRITAAWPADAKELAANPVVSAMNVAAGAYRVRASARDAGGHIGAVDYELAASLTKVGGVEVGALMMGLMADGQFRPKLTFGNESDATAYTELYGADAGRADVRFELARTTDSSPLESVLGTLSPTRDADRWIATGRLPVAQTESGDVVVRAVISSGSSTGQIVRTLRKR